MNPADRAHAASTKSDERKAIFLSYASQDAEAARRICEALRTAGVEVWFDQSELRGGDVWDAKIRQQIKECALFVPIISANTDARPEGYFRLEWLMAVERARLMADDHPFLFPVAIGDVQEATARVPPKFREVQWTRVRGAEAPSDLVARVLRLLNDEPPQISQTLPPRAGAAVRSTRQGRRYARWRLPFLVAAVAIIGATIFWPRARPLPESPATPSPTVRSESNEVRQLRAQIAAIVDKQADANRDDWLLAESLGAHAVKLEPGNAAAWSAYAQAALGLYEYFYDRERTPRVDARKRAQQALTLAPESIDAQLALADCLRHTPETRAEAEQLLQKILQARPDDGRALRLLAGLVRTKRVEPAEQAENPFANIEAAIALYDRAATLPGGDAVALRGKAMALMDAGRYAEADLALDASAALRPGPSVAAQKIWSLLLVHDDVAGACELASKSPGTYLLREQFVEAAAYAWWWKGEPERCLRILSGWNEDMLFDVPKALLAGYALEQLGRPDAAKASWRAALKVVEPLAEAGASEQGRAAALSLKARLHGLLGETAAADEALRLFVQSAPGGFSQVRQAWVHVALGRVDQALEMLVAAGIGRGARMRFDGRSPELFNRASLRHDPAWNPLRQHPRFASILQSARAPLQPAPVANQAARAPAQPQ